MLEGGEKFERLAYRQVLGCNLGTGFLLFWLRDHSA